MQLAFTLSTIIEELKREIDESYPNNYDLKDMIGYIEELQNPLYKAEKFINGDIDAKEFSHAMKEYYRQRVL